MAAVNLRSGEGVGSRRACAQEFVQQFADFGRPGRMMVAPGMTRRPSALAPLGSSAQIVGIEDVEATAAQAEFADGVRRGKVSLPEPGHNVANEGRRMPSAQLLVIFFKPGAYTPRSARAHILLRLRLRKMCAVLV